MNMAGNWRLGGIYQFLQLKKEHTNHETTSHHGLLRPEDPLNIPKRHETINAIINKANMDYM